VAFYFKRQKEAKKFGNNNRIVKMKIIRRDSQVESSLFGDVMQRNIPED
jgi:hypothetical protein